MRRLTIIVASLLGVALVVGVAALLVAPWVDLAPLVAARATAQLGRPVTIASLRLVPGRALRVELRGARLGNIAGGSQPDMAVLERLGATLDWLALLRGQVVLRQAEVEGFSLLLERTPDRHANWRFDGQPRHAAPADRGRIPIALDLRLARSEVVFRTSGGQALRARLDAGSIGAAGAGQPIALTMQGAYNDVPVTLEGTLGSFAVLRDGPTPFPLRLRAASGATTMVVEGTSIDPLNADGLAGTLTLDAPTPDALLAMAGAGAGPAVPLVLSGKFARTGDLWRLTAITGALDGAPFTGALLQLTEGRTGQPDAVAVDLDFTRLDVDRLLVAPRDGGGDGMPMRVVALPDPLLKLQLAARALLYGRLNATDARLTAEVAPGRIVIETLSLLGFGAQLDASAALTPKDQGASIHAEISLMDGNIDTLRRAFGLGALPVTGQLQGRVVVQSEGTMLNDAARAAHVQAVLGMTGGTVAREVIEMASTDVRALFRTARGTTPLTCLIGVVDIRAGRGEAAPLRIRAGTGTVSGLARFDLNRRQLDLVIGSQSETTHFFALDIPVRVSGSFADPDIAPAEWSREGRARLTAGDTVVALPPGLRDFARRNPCFRPAASRP